MQLKLQDLCPNELSMVLCKKAMIAIEYIMHYKRIMYNSAAAGNDLACDKKYRSKAQKRSVNF
jgi:hypothetical protein